MSNLPTFRDVIRYHCQLRDNPQANVDETRVLFPAEFSKMLPYTKLTNVMHGFDEVMCLIAFAGFDVQISTWM